MSGTFNLVAALSVNCVEPQKRMVGGEFKHAVHRFTIKGGMTVIDMMTQSITPTETPLLAMLMRKSGDNK